MKMYLFSLGAGLLAGAIYSFLTEHAEMSSRNTE